MKHMVVLTTRNLFPKLYQYANTVMELHEGETRSELPLGAVLYSALQSQMYTLEGGFSKMDWSVASAQWTALNDSKNFTIFQMERMCIRPGTAAEKFFDFETSDKEVMWRRMFG